MKNTFSIILLLQSCLLFGQSRDSIIYSSVSMSRDTILWGIMAGINKQYEFVFEGDISGTFYKKNANGQFDTIHNYNAYSYGPYSFKRVDSEIVFKKIGIDTEFRALYSLTGEQFIAPELLSSRADSYLYYTRLLDSTSKLKVGKRTYECFRFEQYSDDPYTRLFRIFFVDKKTFLPLRFEHYDDKSFRGKPTTTIFARFAQIAG